MATVTLIKYKRNNFGEKKKLDNENMLLLNSGKFSYYYAKMGKTKRRKSKKKGAMHNVLKFVK